MFNEPALNTFDPIVAKERDGLKGYQLVESKKISCEVSLENYFGCGTGICYGCTIQTREGNKRVCTDGPVFDLSVIDPSLL